MGKERERGSEGEREAQKPGHPMALCNRAWGGVLEGGGALTDLWMVLHVKPGSEAGAVLAATRAEAG